MRKPIRIAAIAAVACGVAIPGRAAERVTFTKDVQPILQENCVTCHRPGGDNIAGMVAPMSLTTYREVRPWAKAIAQNVEQRSMPPWFTTEEFAGVFANERTLTDDEIATVVAWVEQGAARGNPADAPPPVEFESSNGWLTGTPDLIVRMPEPYFIEDDVEDEYVSFVTEPLSEEVLPADRWLKAIEWRGDSDVVHHIVGAASLEPAAEEGDPERFELGSIAPGEEGTKYPPGYGKLLRKGSRIHFNMHYHKEPGPGTGKWDQSSVGFQFWTGDDPEVRHAVERSGITHRFFEIPPRHPYWEVGAARTFEKDTTILSLHPHMHLRGKDALYTLVYPDGTRERLLHVPDFDFNWQLDYFFKEPKSIPAGSRVEFIAHYDNSEANEFNPDPTVPMVWGGPTTMEMMIGYISYTDTEPADFSLATGTD